MFKVGDVVTLKSGGPLMTVQEVEDFSSTGSNDGVRCIWFDDNKTSEEKSFNMATLEKYED